MTQQHTPGPWFYRTYPLKLGFIEVLAPSGQRVAGVDCTPEVNEEANARVIAAAPELLAALTKIATAPEGAYSRNREQYLQNVIVWCQETARAAIAKASRLGGREEKINP